MAEFLRRLQGLIDWYQGRIPAVVRVGLVLAWAGLIWWLSSRSAPRLPTDVPSYLWNLGHVGVFGVLAGLIILSTQGCTPGWSVVAVLLTAAYGALDEWHQGRVPGRSMDFWDVCSDSLGACLTAAGLHWLVRRGSVSARLCLLCVPLAAGSVFMASR